MIDTGCQVTILATLVFECMSAVDPDDWVPAPTVQLAVGIGGFVCLDGSGGSFV